MLDKKGNLSGFDSLISGEYTTTLVAALNDPSKLAVPEQALQKINSPIQGPVTMGGNANSNTFVLTRPVGVIVESDQPLFTWQPLPGASTYSVTIFEYGGGEFAQSKPLDETQWQLNEDTLAAGQPQLERGKTYIWQVTAIRQGTQVVADKGSTRNAIFMILSLPDFERLDEVRSVGSALLLGVLYSEMGILEDAEREFQKLQRENPNNPTANKLLESIRNARRSLEK